MCVFQEDHNEVKVLNNVVEITVENEVIANLPEPIRITFHHDTIYVSFCVCVCVLPFFVTSASVCTFVLFIV